MTTPKVSKMGVFFETNAFWILVFFFWISQSGLYQEGRVGARAG